MAVYTPTQTDSSPTTWKGGTCSTMSRSRLWIKDHGVNKTYQCKPVHYRSYTHQIWRGYPNVSHSIYIKGFIITKICRCTPTRRWKCTHWIWETVDRLSWTHQAPREFHDQGQRTFTQTCQYTSTGTPHGHTISGDASSAGNPSMSRSWSQLRI